MSEKNEPASREVNFFRDFFFQGWRKINVIFGKENEMKIPKQEYPAEFKKLAIKRAKEGMTPSAAAKDLCRKFMKQDNNSFVNEKIISNYKSKRLRTPIFGIGGGC